MALPAQKTTALEARLAAMALPEGGWTDAARKVALTRVQTMGLPDRRDEYWRYTRPDTLVQAAPVEMGLDTSDEPGFFAALNPCRLVFVDGVFDADGSDLDALPASVSIERLADQNSDLHWARDIYGVLESAGQVPVERPLAALNTAFASDGILVHVTGKADRPIHIVYQNTDTQSDVMLHHVVKVDAEAEVTLLESGPTGARTNMVMEVSVADTGAFHHVRVQGREQERQSATHIFGRLGTESTFKSFTLTVNGQLTRNECVLELTGDDAIAHVAGACVGDGDFHHDDTVFVTHDAVACESRQVFKKVLRNGAKGVFQGKILVKEGAQKTDGYQISQSLLLDDDSQFLAKPELEIYADDVACSHGSTSGAIDETALFYLRARGVPVAEATDLLTLAFLAEAVDEIDNADLREEIVDRLTLWLERRRA